MLLKVGVEPHGAHLLLKLQLRDGKDQEDIEENEVGFVENRRSDLIGNEACFVC